jgi:hypothetical protein
VVAAAHIGGLHLSHVSVKGRGKDQGWGGSGSSGLILKLQLLPEGRCVWHDICRFGHSTEGYECSLDTTSQLKSPCLEWYHLSRKGTSQKDDKSVAPWPSEPVLAVEVHLVAPDWGGWSAECSGVELTAQATVL